MPTRRPVPTRPVGPDHSRPNRHPLLQKASEPFSAPDRRGWAVKWEIRLVLALGGEIWNAEGGQELEEHVFGEDTFGVQGGGYGGGVGREAGFSGPCEG